MAETKVLPECFRYIKLTKQEANSLKALYVGDADPFQQKQALAVIVNKFCRTHESPYVPSSFDQSSFIAGRGFVGQKILKYLKLPIGQLVLQEEEETSDETTP